MTSSAQDAVWLLDRVTSWRPAHQVCRAFEISGLLRVEALRAAWYSVVGRHEILRTTLTGVAGRPVASVSAGTDSFRYLDQSDLPPAGHDARTERLAAEPLDLAAGPVARLTVIRLSAAVHRVVLVLHRAAADDRSLSLVLDELSACYPEPASPGPVPPQYAVHAAGERARQETAEFRKLLRWWKTELTPVPGPPVLPVERPRFTRPPAADGAVPFSWEALGSALAGLCRAERTTPLAVLLAAFQAVLHRYGGGDRVPVGVPVGTRTEGCEKTIGPFGNTLVLCGDFAGGPTFRELVARSTATVRSAFERRAVPFGRLLRELDVDHDPRRTPLCDAMLVVHDEPEAVPRLAGTTVRRYDLGRIGRPRPWQPAELTLIVTGIGESIDGALEFHGDLLRPEQAAVLLGQTRTLLAGALAKPDTVVDELPLEDAERSAEIARAADRSDEPPAAVPVHELVRGHAERVPSADAVVWSGGTMTYAELERQAVAVATRLRALGVAGRAAAVRMTPGPHQLAASLGALRAGAHLIWFGTGDAGDRAKSILAELRPACLLLAGAADADELAGYYRDELGGRIVDVTAPGRADAAGADGERVTPEDPVYVAYTSGSTGKPKGVAQSHGSFAQFVTWFAGEFGFGPGARVAAWVAPEHDPSICEVFAALSGGATLLPVPENVRVHPEKLADWLAVERITFLQTVPSFARELLVAITGGRAARPVSLRHLVLMGEALPADLVDGLRAALPETRVANMYGPTETIAATWCVLDTPVIGSVPIGRPIPGRQVLVLDGADRPCPTGVTGEIVIRGPHVARGYLGGDERGGAFRPVRQDSDGDREIRCYRTGDLARVRWDGQLEFRGRKDFQVKLQGNRIELAEVEAALAGHESVAECVVVPLTGQDGLVAQLIAYVVPRDSAPVREWRTRLRRRFGASMVLVSFEIVADALPRNLAGKVDRRRLPPPRALRAGAGRAPGTWVEREVAAIWSDLLGIAEVGADDGFFASGGHSLLIPELADRLRERFGVAIPSWDCFENCTVSGLSALLGSAGVREDPDGVRDMAV
ncbi:non-ribosomal peptide synthetase [Amycolatopsis sp. TRM77291]